MTFTGAGFNIDRFGNVPLRGCWSPLGLRLLLLLLLLLAVDAAAIVGIVDFPSFGDFLIGSSSAAGTGDGRLTAFENPASIHALAVAFFIFFGDSDFTCVGIFTAFRYCCSRFLIGDVFDGKTLAKAVADFCCNVFSWAGGALAGDVGITVR